MMNYSIILRFIFVFLLFVPLNAYAYIGPGLGGGTIGAILGVIGSVFLAIFAVVYYPIKRLLKKKGVIGKGRTTKATETPADSDQAGGKGK
jgi:hypothetical protein